MGLIERLAQKWIRSTEKMQKFQKIFCHLQTAIFREFRNTNFARAINSGN